MAASFVALLVGFALSQFFRAFLAVVSGDLARDLGLDAGALGSLSAAFLLAFALAQLPIGFALDRYGPRRTLPVFMAPAVVGALWLSLATGGGEALAAFGLIGAGCGANLMAAFYHLARTYPVARFAAMSSLLVGLGSLGDPLSGAPLAFAVAHLGWRNAVLGSAALTAATLAFAAAVLRDLPPAETVDRDPLAGFRDVVRLRALWPILPITAAGYAVVISVRSLWIEPYLANVQHVAGPGRSVAATGMGLAMACASLLYPAVSVRVGGYKRAVQIGTGAAACSCCALALVPPGVPVAAAILVVAVGAFGMTYTMIMTHARSFMPTRVLGAGVTFMNLAFMGGAALLQWLSGLFVRGATAAGVPDPAIYRGLFLAFAAALLLSLVVYGFAPARPEEVAADPR